MPLTRLREAALAGNESEWLRLKREEQKIDDKILEIHESAVRLRKVGALPGVSLTQDQLIKIRSLVSDNKILEAQKEIMDALDKWIDHVEKGVNHGG